jgi:uncharacterized protein YcfJ
MKNTWLIFSVVALAAVPAQAQLFRPSVVNGALLGGVAGAIIGNNSGSGGHTGEGAAIGVVAGALLGAAVDNARQPGHRVPVPSAPVRRTVTSYYEEPAYCPPPAPTVVYVQPAVVYARPVYTAPVRYVVVAQPRPVVVYQSYGYSVPVYRTGNPHGWHGGGHGHHGDRGRDRGGRGDGRGDRGDRRGR